MAFSVPLWNKKKAALALGSTAWRPNFVSNQETGSELSYVVPNRTWVGFVIINYINISSKTLDLLLVKFVPLKKTHQPDQEFRILAAPNHPTRILGALVFPAIKVGKTEASHTLSPSIPWTFMFGSTTDWLTSSPMRAVQLG